MRLRHICFQQHTPSSRFDKCTHWVHHIQQAHIQYVASHSAGTTKLVTKLLYPGTFQNSAFHSPAVRTLDILLASSRRKFTVTQSRSKSPGTQTSVSDSTRCVTRGHPQLCVQSRTYIRERLSADTYILSSTAAGLLFCCVL